MFISIVLITISCNVLLSYIADIPLQKLPKWTILLNIFISCVMEVIIHPVISMALNRLFSVRTIVLPAPESEHILRLERQRYQARFSEGTYSNDLIELLSMSRRELAKQAHCDCKRDILLETNAEFFRHIRDSLLTTINTPIDESLVMENSGRSHYAMSYIAFASCYGPKSDMRTYAKEIWMIYQQRRQISAGTDTALA